MQPPPVGSVFFVSSVTIAPPSVAASPAGRLRLLDADPDLASGLSPDALRAAGRALWCATLHVERGRWEEMAAPGAPEGWLGALVLDGFAAREVTVAGKTTTDIVGPGDVLLRLDLTTDELPVPFSVSWRVIEPLRVAVLDPPVVERLVRWPPIVAALLRRTARRTARLALLNAIAQLPGVEVRLLVLLWHLADRWGRVSTEGVVLPIPLTHETLGQLIGAQRPTVSTALKRLERKGALARRPDQGWLLRGGRPEIVGSPHEARLDVIATQRPRGAEPPPEPPTGTPSGRPSAR